MVGSAPNFGLFQTQIAEKPVDISELKLQLQFVSTKNKIQNIVKLWFLYLFRGFWKSAVDLPHLI